MKKVILVLLISVLAAGMVFAADSFTGSFTTSLSYDIDNNELSLDGAKAWKGTASFSFKYLTKMDKTLSGGTSGQEAAAGEKPWAEIAATWKLAFTTIDSTMTIYQNAGKTDDKTVTYPNGYALKTNTVTFSTAKIHGVDEAWVLDLLNSFSVTDYAKSALDYKIDGDKVKYYLDFAPAITNVADYSVSLSVADIGKIQIAGNANADGANVRAAINSEELSFVDDQVTVQAAAAVSYSPNGLSALASAKASAAFEDVTASVAADVQIPTTENDVIKADASLAASYKDAVKVNAYFATKGAASFNSKGTTDSLGEYTDIASADFLSAAATVDVAALAGSEDFTASVSATALNVLINKDFDVKVAGGFKDFFTLTVGTNDVLTSFENTADHRIVYAEAETSKLAGFKFVAGVEDVTDINTIYFSATMDNTVVENLTASLTIDGTTEFNALAKAAYTKDAFSISGTIGYNFNGDTFEVSDLGGEIKASYVVEDLCTISGSVTYNDSVYLTKNMVAPDEELVVSIKAVSTSLVENATLSLAYQSGDLLAEAPTAAGKIAPEFGSITAAVSIAF